MHRKIFKRKKIRFQSNPNVLIELMEKELTIFQTINQIMNGRPSNKSECQKERSVNKKKKADSIRCQRQCVGASETVVSLVMPDAINGYQGYIE